LSQSGTDSMATCTSRLLTEHSHEAGVTLHVAFQGQPLAHDLTCTEFVQRYGALVVISITKQAAVLCPPSLLLLLLLLLLPSLLSFLRWLLQLLMMSLCRFCFRPSLDDFQVYVFFFSHLS
jgi:hypothetical protein